MVSQSNKTVWEAGGRGEGLEVNSQSTNSSVFLFFCFFLSTTNTHSHSPTFIHSFLHSLPQLLAHVSFATETGLLKAMSTGEWIQVPGTSVKLPNLFALNTQFSAIGEFWILVHYLSKFLDFFDTIFIALRKKDRQMSFLHLYHHATIGPIWGLLLYLGYGSGTATFGACINSFTHVLMYTHYLVSALGVRHPFKPLITSWQIVQFYSCIAHALVTITPLETVYPKYLAWLQLAYHITMIVLFTRFFNKTYAATKKPAAPATNGNTTTTTTTTTKDDDTLPASTTAGGVTKPTRRHKAST